MKCKEITPKKNDAELDLYDQILKQYRISHATFQNT
jgi:hypothetical protein